MKRVKSVNGYTIYEATSARDEANYNCHVGEYNIYLSSDIRDFGLSNSYAEFESVETLSVAEAMCGASKYAVAVDLAEEISGSTAQDMDLVLEIERLLEDGLSIEEVRNRFDEDLHELDELGERLAAVSAELDAQTVSTDDEDDLGFPADAVSEHVDEPTCYDTILSLLWIESEDRAAEYFYAFPAAEHYFASIDPELELSYRINLDHTIDVIDNKTGDVDDSFACLRDLWAFCEKAFEDHEASRSHASFIVARDPDTGEYQTKSQPLTKGLPTQAHADHALLHEAAKMYAFSDCGAWEVVEIMIDGYRVQYTGWLPGMRFVFRYVDSGDIAFDESFPEWDH